MTSELEQLKNELLTRPIESRASLAHALINSLDDSVDVDAEALWAAEIRRRNDEIRSGTAKLKSLDVVLREARELVQCLK